MENYTSRIFTHNISKIFSSKKTSFSILDDITVTFEQGISYAITGKSGVGKSTFMHIIAGLDKPTDGTVFFNNQNLYAMREKERALLLNTQMGVMFQDSYLIDQLTVLENIMLKGLIAGLKVDDCQDKAHELLSAIDLEDKTYVYPRTLSGGQKQRVALLRALFNKPDFLFADEPTGNLDEKNSQVIIDILLGLAKQWGMGLIICSHDPCVVQRMDHVYSLHMGGLMQQR